MYAQTQSVKCKGCGHTVTVEAEPGESVCVGRCQHCGDHCMGHPLRYPDAGAPALDANRPKGFFAAHG